MHNFLLDKLLYYKTPNKARLKNNGHYHIQSKKKRNEKNVNIIEMYFAREES